MYGGPGQGATESAGPTALAVVDQDAAILAPWASSLLALGARLSRRRPTAGAQLVVVLTVPIRDYAACLVAAGWVLTQRPASSAAPLAVASTLPERTPVRILSGWQVTAGLFFEVREELNQTRLHVGASWWDAARLMALHPAVELTPEHFGKAEIHAPGSLIQMAHPDGTWPRLVTEGQRSVRVVGTLTRLLEDMDLALTVDDNLATADTLARILWPDRDAAVTALSSFVTAVSDEAQVGSDSFGLTILDGSTAVTWLDGLVSGGHVVTILDRGAADTSAEALILELRSRSTPLDVRTLAWSAPPGIEALMFEVPR